MTGAHGFLVAGAAHVRQEFMKQNLFTTDEFGRPVKQKPPGPEFIKNLIGHRTESPYKRFFTGYEVDVVPGRNGKGTKAVRVYTGAIYRRELTFKQCIQRRILYAAMFLCAATMFVLALTVPSASNFCWYTVLAAMIPAFFYSRFLLALNLYVFSGRELKIHEYKNGASKLPVMSRYIDRTIFVPMIATVVMLVIEADSYSTLEIYRAFLLVASAMIVKTICKLDAKVGYMEITPDSNY